MSDQETTDNFWQAWASWDRQEPEPVTYRLYHDDQGQPIVYTMERLPGNYIEVDHETYTVANYHVRVIDGKLHILDRARHHTKLRPDINQGTPCDPRDICVVVDPRQQHIKWTRA